MQSKATTVSQYLASLPPDRREALETVRGVILENLDPAFEEGMQYGMIGYYVPHRLFPAGYHCDPRQPLPFGGLASQKNHMSTYFMCIYGDEQQRVWFERAWAKAGKKLDMGKSCIRFKRVEDLALDVLGELIRRTTAKGYIASYEKQLESQRGTKPGARPAAKPARTAAKKSPSAKPARRKAVAKPQKKASAAKAR